MNTMNIPLVDEILKTVETLPSLPKAVAEIMRVIEDDTTTPEMLTKIIESDIGLVTGVLRLVNSSRYAVRGGVASTQQAVMILGFNTIQSIACTEGVSSYFRRHASVNFDFDAFMRHSLGVACCARVIAKQVNLNPEIAFVSGLLHDVGQMAVAVSFPNIHQMVQAHIKQYDCHIAVAEHAVMGMGHAQIGAHLAKIWRFPTEIIEAIRCHHQIFDVVSELRMADLIHISEVLSHALDLGVDSQSQDDNDQVPALCDGALRRLQITFGQMGLLFDEIEDEYSDFSEMLGV